jgi:hypothetical protein
MYFVIQFNFENVVKIIDILINSLDNKNISELLKIKIYYKKSSIETKLNLFECIIVELMDDIRYTRAIKLIEFIINKLDNNYVDFVMNECDLNLIIANSLKSEYWNNNTIFNLIWKDDFLKYIEPCKLVKVSYWKTSILYESLCNKNLKFVEKILLNENTSKKINFNVKYEQFPEYSGEHTFITLLTYYLNFPNCSKIKKNLVDVLNICLNNFTNVIDFSDYAVQCYIINNNFSDFYKFNKKIIYDNLNGFNNGLMEMDKIEEFKKIKQTDDVVKTFLNFQLYNLCEKNNVKFVKYIIDEYFKSNSIEDVDKSNWILYSFEFVCEKNYTELITLLFDKFIKLHLDYLVSLKYENFESVEELNKNSLEKTKSKKKSTKSKIYYFNKIVEYCSKNNNFSIVEALFDLKYKFNYFSFIDKDETFLLKLIKCDYPNKFIIKVIDKLGEECFPQYLNKKINHTALTLSSLKNNIEVFNTLINKFGDKVHPNVS